MKRFTLTVIALLALASCKQEPKSAETEDEVVLWEPYNDSLEVAANAEHEMERHGIPVSITLAQGLLESNIGQSRLALENNNHFGIKCFSKSCKKGHCTNFNDDHHKDFFRKFSSVEESYAAHSKVLEKDRYRSLFRLKSNDYKGWARGLRKAGYATDPRYADKLIRIIEDLELYQFDV